MQHLFRWFCLFNFLVIVSSWTSAQDISNPLNLVFVADKTEGIVDVIEVKRSEVVYRIELPYRADSLVATPYAPLLFVANVDERSVLVYDLSRKEIDAQMKLSVTPRHLVIGPSGKHIVVTDSEDGGIVIISTYSREIVYQDVSFPATSSILFDPNEIDLYFVNNALGSLGRLDLNTYETIEVNLSKSGNSRLTSPSRSLDGRYIYIADYSSGNVFTVNAYSGVIFNTFNIGTSPARPYTSPEGLFLYLLDGSSGEFVVMEQGRFQEYSRINLGDGVNLVTVGRFDRLNLLMSTQNKRYHIFDNLSKELVNSGEFNSLPLDAQGGVDGIHTFVAFQGTPSVAVVNLETQVMDYIKVTNNGVGAFSVGATNNVCH